MWAYVSTRREEDWSIKYVKWMGQLNSLSGGVTKVPRQREALSAATGSVAPTELTAGRPQTAPCGCRALTLPQSVRTCAGPAAHYCESSGRESVGVSGGVACLSLLRSRQTLWDTIRRGETLHWWDEKGVGLGVRESWKEIYKRKVTRVMCMGEEKAKTRTDWCSGKDLDLNSGDNCFEYWKFFMIFFSTIRQTPGYYRHYSTTAPSK
jgi:hypothetical protein